jgi:hypothetical protein
VEKKNEEKVYLALPTNNPFDTPKALSLFPLHVSSCQVDAQPAVYIAHGLDRVVKFPCHFIPPLGLSQLQPG